MTRHGSRRFLLVPAGIVIAMVFSIAVTGCIAPFPSRDMPATPVPSATPATAAGATPGPTTTAGELPLTANLPYGVTISYPQDWERQDVGTSGARDYGRTTINIANFFSPLAVPKDALSYTTLAVDIDQSPGMDLEQYFNLATVALGEREGSPIAITKHSFQLRISGYNSYELDWLTKDTRGLYIFTGANGNIYIFSFRSQNELPASVAFSGEIEEIYKSIRLTPPDPSLVKHR